MFTTTSVRVFSSLFLILFFFDAVLAPEPYSHKVCTSRELKRILEAICSTIVSAEDVAYHQQFAQREHIRGN